MELTRSFEIGQREVTNAEFQRFRQSHSSGIVDGYDLSEATLPVTSVSWHDAAAFLNWLSESEGLPPVYEEIDGLRLDNVPIPFTCVREPSELSPSEALTVHIVANLDDVIKLIRGASDPAVAKTQVMERAWPAADAASLPAWQRLADSLLTGAGSWRKPGGLRADTGFPADQPASRDAKALLPEFSDNGDAQALLALRALPAAYPPEAAALAGALSTVLLAACSELKLVFAQHQQADYSELALAALQALAQPESGAAERQDARLTHLLVDEMQDTSAAQIRLLTLLTGAWQAEDGRSLFLVGDPQQSIYLFRQARVELFQDILEQGCLGDLPLKVLTLTRNFRSRPALVEWCNRTLATSFARRASPVAYAASEATRPADPAAGVGWHRCADVDEEARQACALIARYREQQPAARIGVLARSRGHLQPLIRELKRARLSYAAQDLDPLATTPAARNYLACTLALRHPADQLQWLRLLRATGLSWADLDRLAAAAPDALWSQRVHGEAPAISAEGLARLAVLRERLTTIERDPALRADLPRAAASLHAGLGLRRALTAREEADVLRLEALLTAHCRGGQLDDEQALHRAISRLYAGAAPAELELMTVHKSKGLEFDIVVLIACNAGLRRGDSPLLRHRRHGQDWLLAARPPADQPEDGDAARIYALLQASARQAEAGEALRLLYVASTRARERLELFWSPAARVDARSFAALLAEAEPELELTGDTASPGPDWQTVRHPRLPLTELHAGDTSAAWRPPPLRQSQPSQLAGAQRDRAESGLDWPRIEASLIGTALHELLEFLADRPAADWPAFSALLPPLRAGLARRGLPADRLPAALTQIEQLAGHVLSGWGRYLLAPKPWARNEYPLAGFADGTWQSAVIDRCFTDERGQQWVLDYKSNAAPAGDRDAWAQELCAHYDEQLQNYCRLLSAQQADRPVGALIYLLADDRLMQRNPEGYWQRLTDPAVFSTESPPP